MKKYLFLIFSFFALSIGMANAQSGSNFSLDDSEVIACKCDSLGVVYIIHYETDPKTGEGTVLYEDTSTGNITDELPKGVNLYACPSYEAPADTIQSGFHSYLIEGANFTIPANVLSYSITTIKGMVSVKSPSSPQHQLPVTATIANADPRNGYRHFYDTPQTTEVFALQGCALITFTTY